MPPPLPAARCESSGKDRHDDDVGFVDRFGDVVGGHQFVGQYRTGQVDFVGMAGVDFLHGAGLRALQGDLGIAGHQRRHRGSQEPPPTMPILRFFIIVSPVSCRDAPRQGADKLRRRNIANFLASALRCVGLIPTATDRQLAVLAILKPFLNSSLPMDDRLLMRRCRIRLLPQLEGLVDTVPSAVSPPGPCAPAGQLLLNRLPRRSAG